VIATIEANAAGFRVVERYAYTPHGRRRSRQTEPAHPSDEGDPDASK